jgi:hypothetical protein
MPSLRLLFRAVPFLVSVLLLAAPRPAVAASVTMTESLLEAFPNRPYASRFWIGRAECVNDAVYHFPVVISDTSGRTLEVWAGIGSEDCTVLANRDSPSATCWWVAQTTPILNSFRLDVKVRDIVARVRPFSDGQGTLASCDASFGSAGAELVTLDFILMPQDTTNDQAFAWPTKIDLLGPTVAGQPALGIGGTLLKLSWTPNTGSDVSGYKIFCDPPPGSTASTNSYVIDGGGNASGSGGSSGGSGGAADAGDDASDAEAGAGAAGAATTAEASTTTSSSCNSVRFMAGTVPDAALLQTYTCGDAPGGNSGNYTIKGLTDFVQYTVALSAYDAVGNYGPLSAVNCESPQPVLGVYEAYRTAGGTAGGGSFCAVGAVGQKSPGTSLAVVASLAGLAGVRRRRSRSIRKS